MGSVMLGDYYLKQNNYYTAIKYYQKGLEKDSALNYARMNLSVAYNLSQQNDLALRYWKMPCALIKMIAPGSISRCCIMK
jgi:tetratricopeptide (TPR) repeat protein